MDIAPIETVEQAVIHIKQLSRQEQQSVFDYVYQMISQKENHSKTSGKRQFGLYQGKGSFKISDDWEMSEEELLGLQDEK